MARIRPVALPGGDAAVREPCRMALAHLISAGLGTGRVRHPAKASVEAMVREGVGVVPTSSAGRLFDAVASLLGVRDLATYEGQAAVELDARVLVRAIVEDLERGTETAVVSARVHTSLAEAIAESCQRVRERSGLGSVALTGGCFQSRLLTRLAAERLEAAGFEVLLHARVPPSDGGLSLAQAAVAAWRHRTGG